MRRHERTGTGHRRLVIEGISLGNCFSRFQRNSSIWKEYRRDASFECEIFNGIVQVRPLPLDCATASSLPWRGIAENCFFNYRLRKKKLPRDSPIEASKSSSISAARRRLKLINCFFPVSRLPSSSASPLPVVLILISCSRRRSSSALSRIQ